MSSAIFQPLETARLWLRQFTAADLPSLLAYRNDPVVAKYQSWESMTEAEGRAFIEEMSHALPDVPGDGFQFAIVLKEHEVHIGDCFFKLADHDARQAELGYTLARTYWGRGFASEAVHALLDYSFLQLNLHRVIATTDSQNTPSFTLLERLGLRREGDFHQNIWFKGAWGDEYLYAMLQDEWLGRR